MSTLIKRRVDRGDLNAFVFVELREFLPNFCPEFSKVSLDAEADSQVPWFSCVIANFMFCCRSSCQVARAPGKRLDFDKWLLAWDQYTLSAVALQQFSHKAACLHKRHVARMAVNANSKGLRPLLGVLYDELARQVQLAALGIVCIKFGFRICAGNHGKTALKMKTLRSRRQ